jgi:hypothetical protein
MTHTTLYSKHNTNFTPDSSAHTPSHVIKAGLGTPNTHNIYIHGPVNNATTQAL